MAQRVNGVSGILERVVRDCETVTLDDTGELAKIFARLERVAEELQDAGHSAAELAEVLSLAVEQVVDGAGSSAFNVVKKGVLVLQSTYEKEGALDQNLIENLRAIAGVQEGGADPFTLDELLDTSATPVSGVEMDQIDWKDLPHVDLDALEDRVAQETASESAISSDDEDSVPGEAGEDDQLAAEAQEIRAQLSETGYVVFEEKGEPLSDELAHLVADEDIAHVLEETEDPSAEWDEDLDAPKTADAVDGVADKRLGDEEDAEVESIVEDIATETVGDEEDAEVESVVEDIATETVGDEEDAEVESVVEDIADELLGDAEDDHEDAFVDMPDPVLESSEEETTDHVEEDDGLDIMTGALSAFLEDKIDAASQDSEDESSDQVDSQTGEDLENMRDPQMPDDVANHMDSDETDVVSNEQVEDSFWTEAEPVVESDPEVVQAKSQNKTLDDVSENDTLAQIALGAMTLDLDDMSGLGRVHTLLETLASEYEDRPLSVQLAKALGIIIEKIILFECDEVENPLALICDGIAMLQQMDQEVHRGGAERFTDEVLIEKVKSLADLDLDGLIGETQDDAVSVDDVSGTEVEAPTSGELTPIEVDQDIFFDFASEAVEHLETAESKLLELESNSEDKEVINAVFRSFHTIKGASGFLNLEDVTRVAHCVEDVLDSARKGSLKLTSSILDVALESLDMLGQLIEKTKSALENGQPVYAQDVTAFVEKVARVAKGEDVSDLDVKPVVEDTPQNEKPVVQNGVPENLPVSDNQEQSQRQHREQSYVRVGTERLDQLVNLVGELVIAQTQVSQNPDVVNTLNQKLTKDISQLMKISTDIQEISMAMRMVPIRSTFERMARIVRDLARKCGKQVRFEMSGEDTELDKNVVEELVDPLTHMVRNAVDHGIEAEDDRLQAGKPAQGAVHLNAYHKSGNIVIELRDDGKGLDRDKIFKKAVERGLVAADAQMSDEEVFALVFQPGFSTAEKISDISGRGVGMDVVRRNIEGLRGRAEVTSTLGKGSTFTIRLPLTLAIIDGMVIGVGEERYILPMTAIARSLRPEKDDVFYVMGKGEMIRVQEELLPVVRLYKRFDVKPACEDICESLVVIVEAEGKRCGVVVDELLGMQQVVIKGLHDRLRKEPCLSGCAILGDGRVGLILDANGLVRQGNKGNKGDKAREQNGLPYRSAS